MQGYALTATIQFYCHIEIIIIMESKGYFESEKAMEELNVCLL